MKRNVVAGVIALVLIVAGGALAQMDKDMMSDKAMMMDKGGMMDGKRMGMMHSMMQKQVVATTDGGVVIVSGNTLTKYDKNLNVVKEVELKMDMEGMQKMMGKMKGMCPMMGKGMMGGENQESDKSKVTTSAASDEVDHASHH